MAAPVSTRSWFARDADADAVVAAMDSDSESGLSAQEAAARVARIGPSQIAREKPHSIAHEAASLGLRFVRSWGR
jgi:hypothetical protein